MTKPSSQIASSGAKRRWYQFTLRRLLLFVALVATILALLDTVRTDRWIEVQDKDSDRLCAVLDAHGMDDYVGVGIFGTFTVSLSRRDLATVKDAVIQDAVEKDYWVAFRGRDLLSRIRYGAEFGDFDNSWLYNRPEQAR